MNRNIAFFLIQNKKKLKRYKNRFVVSFKIVTIRYSEKCSVISEYDKKERVYLFYSINCFIYLPILCLSSIYNIILNQ